MTNDDIVKALKEIDQYLYYGFRDQAHFLLVKLIKSLKNIVGDHKSDSS